jgi:hypothetical protein
LETELNISQKNIDNLLETITTDLTIKKDIALNSLETSVEALSSEIEKTLSI